MAVQTLLTVEEFDRLPDEERRTYELVRLERKVDECFEAGCAEVWLVFRRLKKVHVHSRGGIREFRTGTTLDGIESLPGFDMPLDRVFTL